MPSLLVRGGGGAVLLAKKELACYAARPEAIPDGEGDVVLGADVQNLVPVCVRKVLVVFKQAQLHKWPKGRLQSGGVGAGAGKGEVGVTA